MYSFLFCFQFSAFFFLAVPTEMWKFPGQAFPDPSCSSDNAGSLTTEPPGNSNPSCSNDYLPPHSWDLPCPVHSYQLPVATWQLIPQRWRVGDEASHQGCPYRTPKVTHKSGCGCLSPRGLLEETWGLGLAEPSRGLPFLTPTHLPHLSSCSPRQLPRSSPSPSSPTIQPGRGRGTMHPGVCIQLLLATAGCIGLCRAREGKFCPPPPVLFNA